MTKIFSYNSFLKRSAIVCINFFLLGCSYNNHRLNKYYTVKKGDTLYSIAKKHKVKYDYLGKINSIKAPYIINQGQTLCLINKNKLQRLNEQINKNKSLILLKKSSKQDKSYKSNANNYLHNASINNNNNNTMYHGSYRSMDIAQKDWLWPAKGKIIKKFIDSGPDRGNGVDIAGNKGDPILSVADGKVVYSGNSLRGYGNLIIIKHEKDFLSAYAHNEKVLVKEQQIIKKGQKIATMGDTEAKQVLLHFEIRYKGKPVDPEKILYYARRG